MSKEGADRRISRYTDFARAIGRGEYDARLPESGDDALGGLGSALEEMSAAIRRRVEERARLAELADRVNSGLTLADVLGHVFESFRSVIPYERIGFAALDEDRFTLRSVWARSSAGPMLMPIGYRGGLQESSLFPILQTGRPRILNDLPAYLAGHPSSDSTRLIVAEGLRSSLTCPLIASGHAVGFLFFSSVAIGTYADVHVGLFERIAGQLAVIVEKGRLYEELARTKRDLEVANKMLHELAAQDALTGLPNRRSLDERLEDAWRRAVRTRAPLSLVLADVDFFKAYNDAYGHQVGDECLKRVAGAFAEELKRPDDFVARYGGEEFLVILENMDAAGAIGMAERLREAVAALGLPHVASAVAGMVTVSLGVAATHPRRDGSAADLLAAADRWLYRAKSSGRNRVAPASPLVPEPLAEEESSVEP